MGALDSSLTVGALRTGSNAVKSLQSLTDPDSSPPYTPANGPNFIPALNQVCERLANEGLWKGVTMEVWYPGSPLGYITLPRRGLTIQGVSVNGGNREIFTQMNQFKYMGMGWRPANKYSSQGLTDLQDGWCTNVDIDPNAPAFVQIQTNPADAGKAIWMDGTDINGNRIFSSGDQGFTLIAGSDGVAALTATTEFAMTSVIAINAAAMTYPWSIWQIPSGPPTGVASLLSLYEPGEQIPKYRRYKTGITSNYNASGPVLVVYARIRPIPLFAEMDPVLPGCYSAIKFGLQALIQEDAMNRTSADKLWADGMVELNNQIKASRGRVELSFPFKPAMPRGNASWVR